MCLYMYIYVHVYMGVCAYACIYVVIHVCMYGHRHHNCIKTCSLSNARFLTAAGFSMISCSRKIGEENSCFAVTD